MSNLAQTLPLTLVQLIGQWINLGSKPQQQQKRLRPSSGSARCRSRVTLQIDLFWNLCKSISGTAPSLEMEMETRQFQVLAQPSR